MASGFIARKIGNRVRLYSRSGGKDVFPLLSPRAHTQPIKISPCRMRVEERSSNKQRIHRLVTSRADAACIAEHSSNVDCPAIAPITVLTSDLLTYRSAKCPVLVPLRGAGQRPW
jgi:hypothetical protein